MRKILFWFCLCAFTAAASAQTTPAVDDATQQQIDKLSGQLQDIIDTQVSQGKRLDDLAKQISDLRDKVNAVPTTTADSASADDLKKLAQQVQEIDQKRVADNEKILNALSKLGNASAVRPKPAPVTPVATANDSPVSGSKQNGYEYQVKAGDTLSGIAKACRDQGVKVTTAQIQAANPKLDPTKLYVGQKIFIPDPNAK